MVARLGGQKNQLRAAVTVDVRALQAVPAENASSECRTEGLAVNRLDIDQPPPVEAVEGKELDGCSLIHDDEDLVATVAIGIHRAENFRLNSRETNDDCGPCNFSPDTLIPTRGTEGRS